MRRFVLQLLIWCSVAAVLASVRGWRRGRIRTSGPVHHRSQWWSCRQRDRREPIRCRWLGLRLPLRCNSRVFR